MIDLNHSRLSAARLFAAALLLAYAASALADVHYVDVNSTNATPPYTNWATAARNIQGAVDVAVASDEVVVANGIYATGGRAVDGTMTNRVAVDKPLTLRSVNGPHFTTIDGDVFNRCAYLTNGASLSGFTLTNGGGYGNFRGGAYGGTLNNCTLTGNFGGGASGSTLNNCALSGNSDQGAIYSTLNNCALTANAYGAYGCTLNNCTLTGNSGGGASSSTLNNCIVYFNAGANYDASSTLNYCCTTPQPTNGVGNISLDPQLASSSHLSAGSPCRGAGNAAYASGTDIDGESWASPPSIGCDEYHAGALTGPLSLGITASFTNVLIGFTVQLTALIEGRAAASSWDFGDGISATNQPYAFHAWTALGDYAVVLRAFNESQPGGISSTVTVHIVAQPVHYVAADSVNPVTPYTSWATAATNIQAAVDAATVPGALVLVTNGSYARVVVGKLLTLQSVNGPQFTTIDGGHSNRCVYLADGASLSGFTLTHGFVYQRYDYGGGGAYGGTLNNCVVTHNVVYNDVDNDAAGGGVYGVTLNNCVVSGNVARQGSFSLCCPSAYGGGAFASILNNCTMIGNSAGSEHNNGSGGARNCTLNNCIVYYNSPYDYSSSTLKYSCTTPQPPNGLGNITYAPLFVDQASGNLRLQSNSPCINAGRNSLAPAGPELDGNPRIRGGTVDIGAYEFQLPTSMISYAWLQQYGLPTDGSTDVADPDGDGLNNWQEWRCGTDPTNALSALRLLAPVSGGTNVAVTWQSVAGVNYFLERTTNLAAPPAFTPLATTIAGQPSTTTYMDTNAIGSGPWFYRVGVSP